MMRFLGISLIFFVCCFLCFIFYSTPSFTTVYADPTWSYNQEDRDFVLHPILSETKVEEKMWRNIWRFFRLSDDYQIESMMNFNNDNKKWLVLERNYKYYKRNYYCIVRISSSIR